MTFTIDIMYQQKCAHKIFHSNVYLLPEVGVLLVIYYIPGVVHEVILREGADQG